MTTYATKLSRCFVNYRGVIAIFLFWLSGLLAGFVFFHVCKPLNFLQMRSLVFQPVSIVGLFVIIFLPLLCTYISLSSNKLVGILIVCFIKAAAFSFTFTCLSAFFDSASWLIHFLYMFSDYFVLIALFLLWIQGVLGFRMTDKRIFLFYTLYSFLIAAFDYYFISPILMSLL